MNRRTNLSTDAGLTDDLLVVAWSVFATIPETHPLRPDFMVALWSLEDAIDNGQPLDAALVAVVQYVAAVSA